MILFMRWRTDLHNLVRSAVVFSLSSFDIHILLTMMVFLLMLSYTLLGCIVISVSITISNFVH